MNKKLHRGCPQRSFVKIRLVAKSYSRNACSNALESWSGHDVPRPLQSMPRNNSMALVASIPFTNAAIPCVLPLQPPINWTLTIMPSSISVRMACEQVPRVKYVDCFAIVSRYYFFSAGAAEGSAITIFFSMRRVTLLSTSIRMVVSPSLISLTVP